MADLVVAADGGCLCGSIRYRIRGVLVDAGYCHCRLCQQSTGAPVAAWATFSTKSFEYTQGETRVFASSSTGRREFCPGCGTQLVFRSISQPDMLDVTLASFDTPEMLAPQYHIWTQSRLTWLHLDDGLPQFEDAGPDAS